MRDIPGFDDPPRRVLAATHRRVSRHQSLRPERPGAGFREVRVQAQMAGGADALAAAEAEHASGSRGARRLQRRARRSRCARSGGVGGLRAREPGGARGARGHHAIWAWSMRFATSSNRRSRSAGGTTARAHFGAITACASISSWCTGSCCRPSPACASTSSRGAWSAPRITRPSSPVSRTWSQTPIRARFTVTGGARRFGIDPSVTQVTLNPGQVRPLVFWPPPA